MNHSQIAHANYVSKLNVLLGGEGNTLGTCSSHTPSTPNPFAVLPLSLTGQNLTEQNLTKWQNLTDV